MLTSCSIKGIGKSFSSVSTLMGSLVPGSKTGVGATGLSALMLYQKRGISFSSRSKRFLLFWSDMINSPLFWNDTVFAARRACANSRLKRIFGWAVQAVLWHDGAGCASAFGRVDQRGRLSRLFRQIEGFVGSRALLFRLTKNTPIPLRDGCVKNPRCHPV